MNEIAMLCYNLIHAPLFSSVRLGSGQRWGLPPCCATNLHLPRFAKHLSQSTATPFPETAEAVITNHSRLVR
jgi:hypothetical protein